METLKNLQQKKITESWNRLPEHEKRRLEKEEARRRKLELRDAKINIWKKWRRKDKAKETEPGTKPEEEANREWLNKIEETLEKIRQEEESRMEARRINEQRRNDLLAERKQKQEEILRKEQEKKDRKIKQNTLYKRWEMMRWVTKYIDENSEKWEREKEKRDQNNQQRLQEWARLSRFEKIPQIKEKQAIKGNKLIVKLKPPVIIIPQIPPHPQTPHNHENNRAEQSQDEQQSNQAEQCHILQGGSRLDTIPAVPV
jgi:hypothetical protein